MAKIMSEKITRKEVRKRQLHNTTLLKKWTLLMWWDFWLLFFSLLMVEELCIKATFKLTFSVFAQKMKTTDNFLVFIFSCSLFHFLWPLGVSFPAMYWLAYLTYLHKLLRYGILLVSLLQVQSPHTLIVSHLPFMLMTWQWSPRK